jgi:hypothetical protein
MILKSFGCSLIFGTDLRDDGRSLRYATGSQLTWPALVAQDLGYEYQTYARPGSGNLQILERLMTQAVVDCPALFVIGWSFIDRFDYIPDNYERWPGTPWKTVLPHEDNNASTFYYKNFHSQIKDKLCTLMYIKAAIDFLKEKNIPFIMTYVDPLIFETKWHTNSLIQHLQDYVRPYMTTFNGETFLNFSRINGYPISETMHPLESAHKAAAKLIKSYNLL